MLRTDRDPELLDFDPVTRFLHWLTLFLVATIFVAPPCPQHGPKGSHKPRINHSGSRHTLHMPNVRG